MTVAIDEINRLVGREFPGGTFTVHHWENVLLHEVVEYPLSPSGLAHPIYLFHAPLAGIGLTYGDIFELCQAESPEAVRAGEYEWEITAPFEEGHTYRMDGAFTGVERKAGKRGGLMDVVTFRITATDVDTGSQVCAVTNSWIFLRAES